MIEHATLEQIAAYLDEPESAPSTLAQHVEECGVCAQYLQLMRGMDDGLRAMPNLAPPAGEWSRVSARLERAGLVEPVEKKAGWWARVREQLGEPMATRVRTPSRPGAGLSFEVGLPQVAMAAATLVLIFAGGFLTGTVTQDGGSPQMRAFDAGPAVGPTGIQIIAGASVQPLGSELARYFEGAEGGLLVLELAEGSLFGRIGLRPGDVLVSAGGAAVTDVEDLRRMLVAAIGEGETVELQWIRRGRAMRGELGRQQ